MLMWSSPLLLLVLVFTLNSRPQHPVASTTSSPPTTHTLVTASSPASLTTPVTIASTTTTTTTALRPTPGASGTSETTPRHPPESPVTTVGVSRRATTTSVGRAPVTTSTLAATTRSVASTATSVIVTAHDAVANVAGRLTLTDPAALVPLHGPGRWVLRADHAVAASLLCGSRSVAISLTVDMTSNDRCLVDINIATAAPTTWNLRATS